MRTRSPSSNYAAFAYPKFRRLWAAGFVSQLGDWMQIIGRAFLAYKLTGKAESVGVIYFATYAPQMIFSLWGGVLADRFDRRRLLVWTQVAQAVGAGVLAVLVSTGTATVADIAGISFLLGIAFMLAIPAQQALVPSVVPRTALTSAINVGTATNSMSRVGGPLLASLVIATAGIQWVFWANAISFLAVIVAWIVTSVPEQEEMLETRSIDAIKTSLRYVRNTPSVAIPIGVSAFLMIVGVVYQPLAVVYATKVLAGGSSGLGRSYYGWLQAAIGIGAAIGITACAGIGRRRPRATFALTALGFSATLLLLGRIDSFGAALVVTVLVGGFHFTNMTLAINLVQHEVPEVMRGRVMAIQMTGLVGVVPITALVGSIAADAFGVANTYTAAGAICLAFSLLVLRWQRYLRPSLEEPDSAETRLAVGALVEEEA